MNRYTVNEKAPNASLAIFPKGHKAGRIPRRVICELCWQAIKPQVGMKIHLRTCKGAK